MNSTAYRRQHVRSPFQPAQKKTFKEINKPVHPVREELQKCIGTHNLTAVIEEDMQTIALMPQIDGLIAFLCTLKKDGRTIGQGRGGAVLGPNNRFVSRAVGYAFNSAIMDAVVRSTKVLDLFRGTPSAVEIDDAYRARNMQEEPATDKQQAYLRQLIMSNIEDEHERDGWMSQIDQMSKREAGDAIQSFRQ